MPRPSAAMSLLALAAGIAACSAGDASPTDEAPPAVANAASEAVPSPASAVGTARIRLSGARTGTFEGEAHFAQGPGLTGEMALNLNLTAVADGNVHVVTIARMGEALPGVGRHPLVGIDAWGEDGTDPDAGLASYAYGRGASAEALVSDARNIIEFASATTGELTLSRSSADRLSGTLRFRAVLEESGGEVTVEAEFDAPRVAATAR